MISICLTDFGNHPWQRGFCIWRRLPMGRSIVRILLVDDYAPWRRFVHLTLRMQDKFQIIGEVGDGMEAVAQAEELQPDLILLDIGLPTLNGIEAARQIRRSFACIQNTVLNPNQICGYCPGSFDLRCIRLHRQVRWSQRTVERYPNGS